MIGNILHYLILFLPIKNRFLYLFLNCQICKCGQLAHKYIKPIYNPNFSCTTVVILLFSWATSSVHIFTNKIVGLQLYTSRTYKFTYSYIFIFIPPEYSYREISKSVIWFHERNIISSWDFYLGLNEAILANMS